MVILIVVTWTALLWLLVRMGVLKRWTILMKVSPLIVYLLAMVALFIPMGSGAPAGPLTVMAYSVQVAPSVSGIVTDVPVKAGVPLKKGDVLLKIDPTPFVARVDQIKAQLSLANLRRDQKAELAARGSGRQTDLEEAESDLAALKAQLDAAAWDLQQTTIRAPTDGYVPNPGIQPGARVNAGVAVIPFLDSKRKAILVQVPQNGYRYIRVGQPAEIAFDLYPGRIFKGTVNYLLPANASGELTPSGLVATIKSASQPLLVELTLDNELASLPPGSVGTAAVYTEHLRFTHPVRKVMMRIATWWNFL
jgi:RND family efflux transporter MFP subunit